MTNFETAWKATNSAAFHSDSSPFSELVIVTPKGGTPRSVYAQIFRDPPERIGPDGTAKKYRAIITLANDATTGVALSEVSTGLRIRFNLRYGVAATLADAPGLEAHLSPETGNQDAAVVRLEV